MKYAFQVYATHSQVIYDFATKALADEMAARLNKRDDTVSTRNWRVRDLRKTSERVRYVGDDRGSHRRDIRDDSGVTARKPLGHHTTDDAARSMFRQFVHVLSWCYIAPPKRGKED